MKLSNFKTIFWAKPVLLLFVLWAVDLGIGQVALKLYQKAKTGVVQQDYNNFFRVESEVVILGNSRAAYHYNPEILEQAMGLSVYNSGREGMGKHYQWSVFEAILQKRPPELVIIDLDIREVLALHGFAADDLNQVLSFHGKSSNVLDSILEAELDNPLALGVNMYKINRVTAKLITGNITSHRPMTKGFRPLNGRTTPSFDTLTLHSIEIDPSKFDALTGLVNSCRNNGSSVVAIISPYNGNLSHAHKRLIQVVVDSVGIPLIDFSTIPDSIAQDGFNDTWHLNRSGADAFSRLLTPHLKSTIAL